MKHLATIALTGLGIYGLVTLTIPQIHAEGSQLFASESISKQPHDTLLRHTLEQAIPDGNYQFRLRLSENNDWLDLYFDSSKPLAERAKFIAASDPSLTEQDDFIKKAIDEVENNGLEQIWCSSFSETIPANAQIKSQTPTLAEYIFSPKAGPNSIDNESITKNLLGRVIIDRLTAQIISLEIKSQTAFKPNWFTKISTFHLKASCSASHEGATYISAMKTHVKGRALMGQFEQTNQLRLSGFQSNFHQTSP